MNPKKFGILKKWDSIRGFGFVRIIDEHGLVTKYFLHISKILSGKPEIGAGCYFDVSTMVKSGHLPQAIDVEIGPVLPKFQHAGGAA